MLFSCLLFGTCRQLSQGNPAATPAKDIRAGLPVGLGGAPLTATCARHREAATLAGRGDPPMLIPKLLFLGSVHSILFSFFLKIQNLGNFGIFLKILEILEISEISGFLA